MNLLNPGVQYFTLFDADGNHVVLDGNSIGPASALSREQLTRTGARGGVVNFNKRWQLEMEFADKLAELEALGDGPFNFSMVKLNGFVFWNEDQRIAINQSSILDPASEDFPYDLQMSDIRNDPDIRQVLNAATPWREGAYETNASVTSFSNGVQTIGHGSDFSLSKTLVLPHPGLTLHFGVTFDALHDDGQNQIALVFRDDSDTVLSTESENVNSTGRHALTATIPADTYSVEVQAINVTGVTANNTSAQIKEPALRLDNSDWFNG